MTDDLADLRAENAALKARVSELEGALEPFARIADIEAHAKVGESVIVNVERCREARSALSRTKKEPSDAG